MELKKIVLLPIPTGWRDSNSPMGDSLIHHQWVFTKFIAHLCCTSSILKRTAYATYFGHFLLCEVKKIVLIPISMGWMGINSPIGDVLSAINELSQKKSTRK